MDGAGDPDRSTGRADERPGSLRVRLLGTVQVEGVPATSLGSRKQRSLLRRLALDCGQPGSADSLAEALWPDSAAPSQPTNQVSVLVSRLRALLGTDRITRTDAGYVLHADWTDLSALIELAAEAERRLREGQPALAWTAADAALALARGPLLADEPDAPWAEVARNQSARTVAGVRAVASRAALALGEPVAAAEPAAAALDADPFDEEALRLLMTSYARSGRPALALAAFERTRRLLAEELGTSPAPQTDEVHTAVLRDGLSGAEPTQPTQPGRPAPRLPLPGRALEWAELDAALAAAQTRAELVLVSGAAGIGKTRLVRDWTDRAAASGSLVLWGTFDSVGAPLSLQAPLDALHRYVAGSADPYADEVLGPEAALVGPLLGLRAGAAPVNSESGFAQGALFAALLAVCVRAGQDGPAILVLDDVHAADPATLSWLSFVRRRSAGSPLLVVVTARPDRGDHVHAVRRIDLGPLDLEAVAEVVGPDRASDLYERTGGHPLLLVELAGAVGDELPTSIRDSVDARVAETGAAAATLRTAAVLGSEVDLDLLSGVLAQPAVGLLADLEAGERCGLLREEGTGFSFQHELVREALLAGTSAARRGLIHRAAARLLLERTDADPTSIAFHARLAGDLTTATVALARAATIAGERFDYDEADRLLSDAIALHPTAAEHLARGKVRMARDDLVGAAADAETAIALGAGPPAVELAGWVAYYRRQFDVARGLAESLEAVLATDDPLLASALTLSGRIDHADGLLAQAGDRLRRAASVDHPARGVAAVWFGHWQLDQGDVEGAQAQLRVATAESGPAIHPFAPAHRALLSATSAGIQGQIGDALQWLDRVEQEVERRHLVHFSGRALNYRAWLLRSLLFADEADELNLAAADEAGRIGLVEPQVQSSLDLADSALRRGDLPAARAALDRAGALAAHGYAFAWRGRLRHQLLSARLTLADDRADEAVELATQLHDSALALGVVRYAVQSELLLHQAGAVAGTPGYAADPDVCDRVDQLLGLLPRVAAPESWWVAATMASAFDEPRWWTVAGERVEALAVGAGPRGAAFVAQAGARLDSMRTRRSNG